MKADTKTTAGMKHKKRERAMQRMNDAIGKLKPMVQSVKKARMGLGHRGQKPGR